MQRHAHGDQRARRQPAQQIAPDQRRHQPTVAQDRHAKCRPFDQGALTGQARCENLEFWRNPREGWHVVLSMLTEYGAASIICLAGAIP